MEVERSLIKEIVETLPIGLYASRRVNVVMGTDSDETSYYDPADDVITISYKIIEEGMKHIPQSAVEDGEYTSEMAVRAMVYHELSHAILTPRDESFMNSPSYHGFPFEFLNIVEDERIETVLKDFYLDVDFKKNVLYINGGTINPSPSNALQVAYNAFRFRVGEEWLIKKVEGMMTKYAPINSASHIYENRWDNYDMYQLCNDYIWAISDLWEEICKHYKCHTNNGMPKSSSPLEGDGKGNGAGIKSIEELTDLINKIKEGKHEGSNISSSDNAEENNSSTEENGEGEVNRTSTNGNGHSNKINIDQVFDNIDNDVYRALSDIIERFNKKSGGGNGTVGYSGVFNPRAVARKDYKYFERKSTVNGINQYGSLHLNLMLDNSGSYFGNCSATNRIIQALIEIEKKNKNFTFDVYFVADYYFKATTNKERRMVANGGNRMTSELFEIVRKAQKPNTYNYNIVMYDGIAYNSSNEAKNFEAYNRDNVTIISDSSNSKMIKKYAPSAKLIIPSDYPTELSKNIISVLSGAFR